MVLDKGSIKEFDSPDELLGDPSTIFYGMAKDANLVGTEDNMNDKGKGIGKGNGKREEKEENNENIADDSGNTNMDTSL